jgi:uncharacterized membrane protein YwzB
MNDSATFSLVRVTFMSIMIGATIAFGTQVTTYIFNLLNQSTKDGNIGLLLLYRAQIR